MSKFATRRPSNGGTLQFGSSAGVVSYIECTSTVRFAPTSQRPYTMGNSFAGTTLPTPPSWLMSFATMAAVCATTDAGVVPILYALALVVGEVFVLAAVAMLFGSFSTPFLTGAFTIGVWLLGRSADEMATMRSRVIPESVRTFLHGLAWVVPNFNLFVPSMHALEPGEGAPSPLGYVGSALAYGLVYSAALLVVACLVFRKRDLA